MRARLVPATLSFVSFVLGAAVVVAQEPAGAAAPFRVVGTFTGSTVTAEGGGERLVLVLVEVGTDQTVYVSTKQKLGGAAFERVKRLSELNTEHSKALLETAKTKKGDELRPALDALRKEYDEKRAAVDRVVVLGRVTATGPVLTDRRAIVVVGEVHDAATVKAAPKPGFAVVEGAVEPGGDAKGFSVKAGLASVAVAGKEAAGGVVRAAGRFRITEAGIPTIDADTVEALKK